ncbi:hypothetical protein [Saccharothrix obliqua]|uniref:hypothetical protein n=1 Tax=Saccharothrix obliqua TaxID=2861747 RepID=UPI001C5EBCC8|nr:hypothetical protein [Saccharothrix obliqua]MBW4719415.1 hypothetical protein [Saccharothrix obliqua]
MSPYWVCFLWITGVLAPSLFIPLVLHGYSLDDAATASGLMAMVAAEVAVRIFGNTPGAGGAGGNPALGPATA